MESPMREQIKALAVELLVKHGYRGFNFRDIAEQLGTTRANLHYHFGNKDRLVLEVLEEYATGTIQAYESVWADPATTLEIKVQKTIHHARLRYLAFNSPQDTGASWSLLIRLRSETDALTPEMQQILRQTTRDFERLVRIGVRLAIHSGELRADAPEEDVSITLANVIHYAGSITRDHGNFTRLELLWNAVVKMVRLSYAGPAGAAGA